MVLVSQLPQKTACINNRSRELNEHFLTLKSKLSPSNSSSSRDPSSLGREGRRGAQRWSKTLLGEENGEDRRRRLKGGGQRKKRRRKEMEGLGLLSRLKPNFFYIYIHIYK